MEVENYPKYYRKDGKCVKVSQENGVLVGRSIELQPQASVPLRSLIPPTRLEAELSGMEQCDHEIWKNFLFTFYQQVQQEREGIKV
jgi:hypothetical protein